MKLKLGSLDVAPSLSARVGPLLIVAAAASFVAASTEAPAEPPSTPMETETDSGIDLTDVPTRLASGRSLITQTQRILSGFDDAESITTQLDDDAEQISSASQKFQELFEESNSSFGVSKSRAAMAKLRVRAERQLKTLAERASTAKDIHDRLAAEVQAWSLTRKGQDFDQLPDALVSEIAKLVQKLESTEKQASRHLGETLVMQARAAQHHETLDEQIQQADTLFTNRSVKLAAVDAPPLWQSLPGALHHELQQLSTTPWVRGAIDTIRSYALDSIGILLLQALCCAAVLGFLLRTRTRPRLKDHDDVSISAVLARPFASALLLALLTGLYLMHSDAPREWQLLCYVFMLLLLLRLLPALWPKPMQMPVYAIVILGLAHWAALCVPEGLVLGRLLWFLAAIWGAFALPFTSRRWQHTAHPGPEWLQKTVRIACRLSVATLAVSALANLGGALSLALFLASGTLVSVYAAILVITVVLIANGIVDLSLTLPAARWSRITRVFDSEVRTVCRRLTFFGGMLTWLLLTLDGFQLLGSIAGIAKNLLTTTLSIGSLELSAGSVLLFALAIWLSFKASRLIRFVLNEEVYPRVQLPQGVPETVSKAAHYTVLLAGFAFAVVIAGFNLDKFALIAGAFSVGIGFGLQTVVNNFVSGLILLFERPVRVGDRVQLGETVGEITEIGIRASRLRTLQGAEVVVPNGNLISNELINWTLSDMDRRVDISIGVAYGTDPRQVISILEKVAADNTTVLKDPSPAAHFVGFGDSSLDFILRAWCQASTFFETGSALRIAINTALANADIEIPFPQRDLHVRSIKDVAAVEVPGDK